MDNDEKIPLIPEPPTPIIEAINRNELVIFIGAGISRLLGCVGWEEFAKQLVDSALKEKDNNGKPLIKYQEAELLKNISDHRKVITIIKYLYQNNNKETALISYFNNALLRHKESFDSVYKDIKKLGGVCVTTNIDKHLDVFYNEKDVISDVKLFKHKSISKDKLYKIHGTIDKFQTTVFTLNEYFDRYKDGNFQNFIQTIFQKYTVLFLGYGLTEYELLEHIYAVAKITPLDEKSGKKRYLLQPYFKHQETFLNYDKDYYKYMGVEIIPYSKNEIGFNQIIEIIKHWNRIISSKSNLKLEEKEKIAVVIEQGKIKDLDDIFQNILIDNTLSNFFFDKLCESGYYMKFFNKIYERGFFSPQYNPTNNEYWGVLKYLEKVSANTKEKNNTKKEKVIDTIITAIIKHKDTHKNKNRNFYTDFTLLKIIGNLKSNKRLGNYLNFIRELYSFYKDNFFVSVEIENKIMKKIINSGDKDAIFEILKIILTYNIDKSSSEGFKPLIETYQLKDIISLWGVPKNRTIREKAIRHIIQIIQEIKRTVDYSFSYYSIQTIDNPEQRGFVDYQSIIFVLLRDLVLSASLITKEKYIKEFLKKEETIFVRLALYIITNHYKKYKKYFWSSLEALLAVYDTRHELFELIKNTCGNYSKREVEKLVHLIDRTNYSQLFSNKNFSETEIKINIANLKRELLLSLVGREDHIIYEFIKKYEKFDSRKIPHPGYLTYSYADNEEEDKENINKGFLENKSVDEIISLAENDKAGDTLSMSKESFLNLLTQNIKNNPEKYIKEIEKFVALGFVYQSSLFNGLIASYNENKKFNLSFLFEYLIMYFNDQRTKNRSMQKLDYSKNGLVSEIADFIEECTKVDEKYVGDSLFSLFKKMLFVLSDNAEGGNIDNASKIVDIILNTPLGKVYEALINYSLQNARINKLKSIYKWDVEIQAFFEGKLKDKKTLELYILFGMYLRNFLYLNKEWVNDNFNNLFPRGEMLYWEAAISSYFFVNNMVYNDIFDMFYREGHFETAIDYYNYFRDEYTKSGLVQQFCIIYFHEQNNTKKGNLILELIKKEYPEALKTIIRSLVILNKNTDLGNSISIEKLKILFSNIVKVVNKHPKDVDFMAVLSDLSKWLCFFKDKKFDEEVYKWLKQALTQVPNNFHTGEFIENASLCVKNNPEEIANLYFLLLQKIHILPTYPEAKVISTIEELFKTKDETIKQIALEIINHYENNGCYFLRDVYNKYKNNKE